MTDSLTLGPDYPVTEDACKEATGRTLQEWADAFAANPDIAGKRREALYWFCDQTSRSNEHLWWATTAWVEYEKRIGRTQKDGRPEGFNICSTKTIKAPVERVQEELVKEFERVTRVRDGKDIRAEWETPGVGSKTDIEVLLAATGEKVGVILNHKRIPDRNEADGLRRYWATRLADLKQRLES